jgi:hypothetical protein
VVLRRVERELSLRLRLSGSVLVASTVDMMVVSEERTRPSASGRSHHTDHTGLSDNLNQARDRCLFCIIGPRVPDTP